LLDPDAFLSTLIQQGVDFFAGVSDSLLAVQFLLNESELSLPDEKTLTLMLKKRRRIR